MQYFLLSPRIQHPFSVCQDVLKILIKHQVDFNRPLSAGKNKVTALMIAAGHGNLDICRVLIQNGAFIDQVGMSAARILIV